MHCINNAYTERGWASVGLWITTAFIPEMIIGIAAGCAAIN